MQINTRKRLLFIIAIICVGLVFTNFSYSFRKGAGNFPKPIGYSGDSGQVEFQKIIIAQYNVVAEYNRLLFQYEQSVDSEKYYSKLYNSVRESLVKADSFGIEFVCNDLKNKIPEKVVKEKLRNAYGEIFRLADQLEKLKEDSVTRFVDNSIRGDSIREQKSAYQTALGLLKQAAEKVSGGGIIKIKNASCRYFIVKKNEYTITIRNNRKGGGQTFDDVMADLKSDHKEPIMITNGGMFDPAYAPQGLLIENRKEVKSIDTTSFNKGNFYLMPNGVFSIGPSGLFHVLKTRDFKAKYASKEITPEFATQSGPMLVFNDTINKNFTFGSKNLNIRSGVGEISPDKIVFIICDNGINFFDFALLFKDIFGCRNALYLDGAISRMFLNEKIVGIENTTETRGNFGPVISVTKSNK